MLLLRQGDRDVHGGVCSSSSEGGALCSSREESVALGLEGEKSSIIVAYKWRPTQAGLESGWGGLKKRGVEEPHPAHIPLLAARQPFR